MKKITGIIIIIFLVISLGLNGYFIYEHQKDSDNDTSDKVFVKYKGKTITEEDYIKDSIEYGATNYYYQLFYDIAYDDLSKDEIEAVQDDVDDYIDKIKEDYDNEEDLDRELYAAYGTHLERYKKLYTVPLAYDKRVEEECDGKRNCSYTLKDEYLKVLEEANIKFENKKAQEGWETFLESLGNSNENNKLNNSSNSSSSNNSSSNNNSNNKKDEDKTETNTTTTNTEFKKLQEITMFQLERLENNEQDFILLFTRASCSHCVQFKPKLDKFADKYNLRVYYIEMEDISDEDWKDLEKKYNIEATPTTIIFKKSKAKDSLVGNVEESELYDFLDKNGLIN